MEFTISVRGQWSESVDPDFAVLHLALDTVSDTKADASIRAGRLLDDVLAGLKALGGEPRGPETSTRSLVWSTTSVGSHPEIDTDPRTGRPGPTGRFFARAQIEVRVRDFDLLDSLQAVLDQHQALSLHSVGWSTDPTNPAWPTARARAVDDAIQRAREYASALGAELTGISQLADTGLLGTDAVARPVPPVRAAASAPMAVHLDPVPQMLSAVIEARFTANGGILR